MLPSTIARVPEHTDEEVNHRIYEHTKASVAKYLCASRENISARIDELNREWDIERILEANASALALTGLFLGATKSSWWYLLSATVLGFLLQHSLEGWCPPMPIMRRLGIRTSREIDIERNALKLLRGDFREAANIQQGQGNGTLDLVMQEAEL